MFGASSLISFAVITTSGRGLKFTSSNFVRESINYGRPVVLWKGWVYSLRILPRARTQAWINCGCMQEGITLQIIRKQSETIRARPEPIHLELLKFIHALLQLHICHDEGSSFKTIWVSFKECVELQRHEKARDKFILIIVDCIFVWKIWN